MSAAPSIVSKTPADLADEWGLEKQSNGKWSGPHPTDKSIAGNDGFVMNEDGTAFTNSGIFYKSIEVAALAGLEPDMYEPCRIYRGQTVTSPSSGQSKPALIDELLPVASEKTYNTTSLEQRGIGPEAFEHFNIKKLSEGPIEYYEYVTTLVSGEYGRNRRKLCDPVVAGKLWDKKGKPIKYMWKPLDTDPLPTIYNIESAIGNVEVWLVGGEVDVWSCWQAGINAVCGYGETRHIPKLIEILSSVGIEKVHIALDNDEAGHKASIKAIEACGEHGVTYTVREIMGLVGTDVNDMFCRLGHDKEKCKIALESLPHVGKVALDRWRGVEEEKPAADGQKKEKAKSSSTDEKMQKTERLVALLEGSTLFIGSEDEEFYIGIKGKDGIERAYPAGDANLKADLFYYFWNQTGKAISDDVVTNAMTILRGRAREEESYRDVALRSGEHEGKIYIDLCDKFNNIVEVSPEIEGGWRVVNQSGIYFRRPKGMQALPVPVRGGKLTDIRSIINADDDDNWRMICAWLVYAMTPPTSPYPALALSGEQGTAKSTTSKILRKTIDPNFTSLIGGSIRDERDLAIMAKNSFVLGFDNLSGLNKWQNDALCQIVTEGSFRTRKMRSDEDEILFKATRPIILNGIDSLMGREDFQSRCLACSLPVIPEHRRQDEIDVWGKFNDMWPSLLGAIFTAMSKAMEALPHVTMPKKPRMADFAKFTVAGEDAGAFSWKQGEFLKTYFDTLHELQEVSIEYSPLASEMVKFCNRWGALNISAKELLERLNTQASYDAKSAKNWPSSPSYLSSSLNRMAVNLRAVGVDIDTHGKANGKRFIKIMPIAVNGKITFEDTEATAYVDE